MIHSTIFNCAVEKYPLPQAVIGGAQMGYKPQNRLKVSPNY